MYNITSFNPAAAGSTSFGDAFASVRSQQLGFEDYAGNSIGPVTQWYGIHMPLKKINSGIGLLVTADKIGFEKTTDFKLSYSYQFKLGEGKLGIGIDLGFVQYTFDLSKAKYPNGIETDGDGSDTWLQSRYAMGDNLMKFVLGAGLFYRSKDIYFGISSSQINEPSFSFGDSETNYINRTYWVNAGYNYQTSNPMWVIKPSALLKSNLNFGDSFNSVAQLSFDLLLQYNKFIIGGVSYTSGNDISPIIGIEINNGSKLDGLRAIFAYDFILSALGAESSGSLEVMVGYSFNLSIEKVTKSYKSVRFL